MKVHEPFAEIREVKMMIWGVWVGAKGALRVRKIEEQFTHILGSCLALPPLPWGEDPWNPPFFPKKTI